MMVWEWTGKIMYHANVENCVRLEVKNYIILTFVFKNQIWTFERKQPTWCVAKPTYLFVGIHTEEAKVKFKT